ncbi:MAG: SGNH/GDSL hydrolase family protein [Pseudodesulfovibrio sp.]
MRARLKTPLCWGLGFLFSCLFIWGVSAVFLNGITPKTWDEAVGRYVNTPGAVIRHRSEGWADLRVARHGLTPEGDRIFFSPVPKFLLWGDSYAEGIQVGAQSRAVNVYNARALEGMPRGVAVADSGLAVADYYFYLPRYEKLTENVRAHVILLAGMRAVMPSQQLDCHSRFLPDPWRFEASECEPSEAALRYGEAISRRRLDFLHAVYRSAADYRLRFCVGNLSQDRPVVERATPGPTSGELREAWTFLLGEFKKLTGARIIFFYTPLRPALRGGSILFEAPEEQAHKALFAELCARSGVGFVDLAPAFLGLYEREGRLAMGFFNTPQGSGHLNAAGQAIIADGLYRAFSGGAK